MFTYESTLTEEISDFGFSSAYRHKVSCSSEIPRHKLIPLCYLRSYTNGTNVCLSLLNSLERCWCLESFRKSPIAASSIDLISIRLLPYSDLVSSASTSKVILIVVDRVLQPLRCAYKRARQKWW